MPNLNPDGTVALDDDPDPQARALAIVNCGLCDDWGYANGRVCDHVDRTEIYRRGMGKVREVLEARKAKQ